MTAPRVVCVLGMHRSGTSLVSRLLHLLGAGLGSPATLVAAHAEANPRGFWEQAPVVELNEAVLRALGSDPWDPGFDPGAGWEHGAGVAPLRERAARLVERLRDGAPVWAFKDPRTCLTLPLWQAVVPDMAYVVCARHPAEVAGSLRTRDAAMFTAERSYALWLRHHAGALAGTSGARRVVVLHEELLADPGPVVDRLAAFLGGAAGTGTRARAVAAVDPALHRQRGASPALDAPGALGAAAHAAYALTAGLARAAGDGTATDARADAMVAALDAGVRETARQRAAVVGERAEVVERLHVVDAHLADARAAIERQAAELARCAAALRGVHASRSWRITAPLRRLAGRRPRRS